MAQIQEGGGGGKGGKKRAKRGMPHVDMTPMVDLGFLLLTFFVMTSTFSKPKIMSLAYPPKIEDPKQDEKPPEINDKSALTFLISEDRVFYYKGKFDAAVGITETNFGPDGVRQLLNQENQYVLTKKLELDKQLARKEIADTTYTQTLNQTKGEPKALKVMVKTDDEAKARNFIDIIDELRIAEIGAFQPVEITGSELEALRAKTNK